MISEESFLDLWNAHKEKLIHIAGCFSISSIRPNSGNMIEVQFEGTTMDFACYWIDFFRKFISGYVKMGKGKVN